MANPRGTVLVVEDNQDVRSMVMSILEIEGYSVEFAETGAVAVSLLDRYVPPPHQR